MGTKQQPGAYDCYAGAELNEPMFILLGRDPMAGPLVRIWAKLREDMGEDPAKVHDANLTAAELERWAVSKGKEEKIRAVVEALKRLAEPA
jgi:hypothetical protein